MKKSALIVAITTVFMFGCKSGEKHEIVIDGPIETVNSKSEGDPQATLDWAGVYEGRTPCVDCEGIKTAVELKTDKSFVLSQSRIEDSGEVEKFRESGNFTWDDEVASSIILTTGKHRIRFQVENDALTLLDMSGNVEGGELANFYILKKQE